MGKAKLSFYLTILILIANIITTYLMVMHYSINGAAIAIVMMYLFSSILGYVALKLVLRGLQND
jgi:O-antigen/teichoic acid export membrane protein